MIQRNARGYRRAVSETLRRNWLSVALVAALEITSIVAHEHLPIMDSTAMMRGAIGVLAGTVGVFLAFKFNGAYQRWWEARTLWGGVVNQSRTFARQATTWLGGAVLRRELVLRQLAFVNALRVGLRRQNALHEVEVFLAPGEHAGLRAAANPATWILQRQSERLAEVIDGDAAGVLVRTRFDETLAALTDLQGGLERIKNTAFPGDVARATNMWVWAISILFALAFIDPGPSFRPMETLTVLIVVLSFQRLAQLGADLNDPFENLPNDTPMTALCRTIERDLRQQLGETEIPPPVEAVGGVLM